MKQSVNGGEFAYKPQEQAPSHCITSLGVSAQHHIGKWGRMHKAYLEEVHPDLYRQLLQDGTLDRHLTEVDERAVSMLEQLTVQMARQEGVTERMKAGNRSILQEPDVESHMPGLREAMSLSSRPRGQLSSSTIILTVFTRIQSQ